jgi:hypothetical protein
MTDTPPDLEARYRMLLLAKSPSERAEMAGDMFAAAKAMMIAGIRARSGDLPPEELRAALFLQLYGSEFDELRRARIVELLRTGAPG